MPYVLPQPDPRLTLWDYYGQGAGKTANILLQAYLAQMGAGGGPFAPKNIPNPGYGQTVPGTGTTFGRPQQGQLSPPQIPQQIKEGFRTPTPGPYSDQPLISAPQFEILQNLQKYQQNVAKAPVEIKALEALAEQRARGDTTTIVAGYDEQGNPITYDIPASKVRTAFPPKSSARDLARTMDEELSSPTDKLPPGLPPASSYPEGTVLRDTETGKRYKVSRGTYIPQ